MMSDEMLAALERLAALPDEMAQLEPGEDAAFGRRFSCVSPAHVLECPRRC